jgi:two-component system, chemotaxis family, sensor kinase CheA
MNSDESEMMGLFVQEATEHLETLESDLLSLETNPRDADRLNRIFRAAHSIKGTAGFFGLTPITDLAHVMESVMSLVRDGRMTATPSCISHLLAGTDKLRLMVAAPLEAGQIPSEAERHALNALLRLEPAPHAPVPSELPTELPGRLKQFNPDPDLVRSALRDGHNLYLIDLRLHSDVEALGHTIIEYLHEIISLGTLLDSVTSFEGIEGLGSEAAPELTVSLLFSAAMEPDLMLAAFGLGHDRLAEVEKAVVERWLEAQPRLVAVQAAAATAPGAAPAAPPAASAPAARAPAAVPAALVPAPPSPVVPAADAPLPSTSAPPPAPAAPVSGQATRIKTEETIRISVTLLDSLMNLAGEMVLGRNQLVRMVDSGTRDGNLPEGIGGVVQGINAVTSELQRTVMRARLQPVGGLFGRFHRILRDLGQKLGKEFQLETVGDDVELDRTILEGLSDPLTHLIRNSADHGIEPIEDRRRANKSPAGHIRLAAAHLAGHVQIEVRDDGRGLDPDRIRAKAVEKGLITSDQATRLSAAEAQALIFAPGFSTAAKVTDISGRGVGMDVVRSNIERLGGRVELKSAAGQGTAVIIRLPLTLAIIPALIISQGGARFAVPQSNLEEIIRPDAKRPLESFGGARMFRLRDELLPVLGLGELLGHPTAADPNRGFLLVLTLDDRRYGLLVDEIADMEEIVVKPLGRHLKAIPLYSGATLLGQGEIALILDPTGLAQGRLPPIAASSRTALAEARNVEVLERVLLFRDGGPETFALHLSNIARVERLESAQIERIGDKDYLRQANGPTLRLLRLHDFLPVTRSGALPPVVHVIIPRLLHHPVALLVDRILDTAEISPTELESAPLRGPGVFGTLPLAGRLTLIVDLYGVLRAAGYESAPALTANRVSSARVLVAEDTALFREAIRRALEGQVAALDLAKDGDLAWQRLQQEPYDVLITDIEMPNCDGFELTRRIRADARLQRLPIIACSARGSDRFLEQARSAGINHYETKLDRDRLLQAVASVLATR